MAGFSVNAKNGMLGQVRGRITHLSLHTADPGSAGANEVSGNGYARVSVTATNFSTPAAGEFALTDGQTFAGPANGACGFFAAWDNTEYLGGGAITGDTSFNAEGVFILQSGTAFDLNG